MCRQHDLVVKGAGFVIRRSRVQILLSATGWSCVWRPRFDSSTLCKYATGQPQKSWDFFNKFLFNLFAVSPISTVVLNTATLK